MMTRREAERQLDAVRSYRVRLRKAIDAARRDLAFGGDPVDGRRRIEALEGALKASDGRWAEVNQRLGKSPLATPVVRIDPVAALRSRAPAATRARRR